MKKLNLTGILIVSCMLFSCQPKEEKKEPVIYQKTQNYKYDDEPAIEKATDSVNKKAILTTTKVTKDKG